MSSPIPYSDRDLDLLRQQLLRGDDESRRAAIKELTRLGDAAKPMASVITEQFRRGLRIPSWEAVDLLEAVPDRDLYDAMVVSGVLAAPGVHEKCRLFVLGLAAFEDELCTYLYRHWRTHPDPIVPHVLYALERAGASEALATLRAIEPEVAEWANTLLASQASWGHRESYTDAVNLFEKQLDAMTTRLATERLTQVRQAIAAIESRETGGAKNSENRS